MNYTYREIHVSNKNKMFHVNFYSEENFLFKHDLEKYCYKHQRCDIYK